jgi:hypothetical protein
MTKATSIQQQTTICNATIQASVNQSIAMGPLMLPNFMATLPRTFAERKKHLLEILEEALHIVQDFSDDDDNDNTTSTPSITPFHGTPLADQ